MSGLLAVVELVALEPMRAGLAFGRPRRVCVDEPQVSAPVAVGVVEDVLDVLAAVRFGDPGHGETPGAAAELPSFADDPCSVAGPLDEFAGEGPYEPVGFRSGSVDVEDDWPFGHGSRVRPAGVAGHSSVGGVGTGLKAQYGRALERLTKEKTT